MRNQSFKFSAGSELYFIENGWYNAGRVTVKDSNITVGDTIYAYFSIASTSFISGGLDPYTATTAGQASLYYQYVILADAPSESIGSGNVIYFIVKS